MTSLNPIRGGLSSTPTNRHARWLPASASSAPIRTDDVIAGAARSSPSRSDNADVLDLNPTTAGPWPTCSPARPMPSRCRRARSIARDVLRGIGIDVADGRSVVLTDRDDTGERVFTYLINPGQLAAACEFRLTTGESIDYEGLRRPALARHRGGLLMTNSPLRPSVTITEPDRPRCWIGSSPRTTARTTACPDSSATGSTPPTPARSPSPSYTGHRRAVRPRRRALGHGPGRRHLASPGGDGPDHRGEVGRIYDEVGPEQWPALCAWVRNGSYVAERYRLPGAVRLRGAVRGRVVDVREYAEQLADDIGLLTDVPQSLQPYFDWASWTRDFEVRLLGRGRTERGVVFRDL